MMNLEICDINHSASAVLRNICIWNNAAWDGDDDDNEDNRVPGDTLPNAIRDGGCSLSRLDTGLRHSSTLHSYENGFCRFC